MEITYPKALPSIATSPSPRRIAVPRNRLGVGIWDLLASLVWVCHPDPLAAVRDLLRVLMGRQNIFFTASGQCAIAQILSLLPHRDVVMPACTCNVVQNAAEVAGKRIIYVDLGENGVNASSAGYAKVAKPGQILLATHLFGIPTDIEAICELAKDRNCVVIEDAAAAFGGRRNGRLLGTFADFGIFSFQRSKRLPAFGGMIVVNNEQIVDPNKVGTSRVVKSKCVMPFQELIQALTHNVATTPWIYERFIAPMLSRRHRQVPAAEHCNPRLPPVYTRDYTREFHPYQAELLLRMLQRMDQIRERIARLASVYVESFRDTPVATFLPPKCDTASLLRFPIAFPGKDRDKVLSLALKRGLNLAASYPILPEKSERARFPNAVWASRNLVLLPLYPRLSPESAELIAQHLIEIEKDAIAV
jgi:dTDP-4-amino-4,6-dideoxygalactose transaminase